MPDKYTEEELEYMRENYGQKTNEEIAEELGEQEHLSESKLIR